MEQWGRWPAVGKILLVALLVMGVSGCVQEPLRSTGYYLVVLSSPLTFGHGLVRHGGKSLVTQFPFMDKGSIRDFQSDVRNLHDALFSMSAPGLSSDLSVLGWVPRMSGRLPLPEGQSAGSITDLMEAEYNKQPDQRDWTKLQALWQQLKDAGYPYAVTVPAGQKYRMENPWYW